MYRNYILTSIVTFLNPEDHFMATSRQLMAWVRVISLLLVLDPGVTSDVFSITAGVRSWTRKVQCVVFFLPLWISVTVNATVTQQSTRRAVK